MYEYIKGLYKGINKEYIIIENNGIGYKIYTSGSTMAEMPKIDEEILLYLEQIVRQDFIGLYGFKTRDELEMFNKLITINGVGAKAALSLLSIASMDKLKYSIVSSDEKTIVKAPGIGKKIAQRIILELKDKIDINEAIMDTEDEEMIIQIAANKHSLEAMQALMALGYSEKEAQKALNNVDKNDSLENIIKNSLKILMN
jgi:holliday junction DNA helicase RuvA